MKDIDNTGVDKLARLAVIWICDYSGIGRRQCCLHRGPSSEFLVLKLFYLRLDDRLRVGWQMHCPLFCAPLFLDVPGCHAKVARKSILSYNTGGAPD